MNKRILIITTGGTIAMRETQQSGVIFGESVSHIIDNLPEVHKLADIDIKQFCNIPSPYMTPQKMFELSQFVDEQIQEYDGCIITHGTDTLEETAYMLDLTLRTRKTVVFTAAMRSSTDLGVDGPRNILGAIRTVLSEQSIDKGVLVVMNDEINNARDVTKTNTSNVETFISPGYGYLGIVDIDKVIYVRNNLIKEKIWTDKIEPKVDLIKAVAGMDDRYLNNSLDSGVKGIVIEAFGRGNLPCVMLHSIKRAISMNIPIIMVSRAYQGRVLDIYGYEGGGRSLKNIGVILGSDLRGPKARIKLMVLLGKYKSIDEIREFWA